MDAAFTEEQDEIRRTLRALLDKRGGPEEARAAARNPGYDPGYDPELWRRLARETGLPGLVLPTAYGGRGHGPTALALACEETGRAVLPAPLIATTVLAAPLILALAGERLRAELLPGLAAGELTATLVVPGGRLATALALTGPNDGDWAGGGRAGGIQARAVDKGWRLYGEAGHVLDGHTADVLVVAAHTGGFARSRTLLFAVRAKGAEGAAAPGLLRTRQTVLDGARPQARVELRDVEAELLGEAAAGNGNGGGGAASEAAAVALAATGVTAAACLAAEAVGAADAMLSRMAGWFREHNRGGRPDGASQAVRRRLVELYAGAQAARSAAYHAAWVAGGGRAEPGVGALALAQGLEALRAVAGEAVRLPGGVGSAGEGAAHLCFQRVAGDELLLGPVHRLRARAAEWAGLFGAGEGVGAVADPAAREAVGA
ncbi:acyl-CoA dehydrogenase family protein [Streptomyces sp. S186]|uniref:acyl-CoA dehydrogenase family protein n=1 Tax=Streptomyces sp. S186 TaxID=3434395 RepID=UPI003F66AE1D